MGYRSDVTVAMYLTSIRTNLPAETVSLPFAALKLWFDETYPVKEAREDWDAEITYGDDYILVRYHDVKYYDGYVHPEEVKVALEKFCDAFGYGPDARAHWEFMRVGEELEDVKENASPYSESRLRLMREIIFD